MNTEEAPTRFELVNNGFANRLPIRLNPNGDNEKSHINESASLSLPYSDPELAEIAAAWDRLPDTVKQTILLLVRSAPKADRS